MDLEYPKQIVADHADAWFSVEACRGETYCEADTDALYAHYEYEASSVLAGQTSRCFVDSWPRIETPARLAELQAAGLDVEGTGCTHVPVSQVTAGLPGEDGFPEYGEMGGW